MDLYLTLGVLYAVLIFYDLIPLLRRKDKKSICFSIPIYAITMILSALMATDVKLPDISKTIDSVIGNIFHIV